MQQHKKKIRKQKSIVLGVRVRMFQIIFQLISLILRIYECEHIIGLGWDSERSYLGDANLSKKYLGVDELGKIYLGKKFDEQD